MLNSSVELYYILSGTGEMHIADDQAQVRQGQIIYIPPGARQFIRNTGRTNLVFLCIVAPEWQADDESLVR